MTTSYRQIILDILTNAQVRKVVSGISSTTIESIDTWLSNVKGQFYISSIDANVVSSGLKVSDRKVMLQNDWGVKLIGTQHPFLNKPTNIRYTNKRFCVTNTTEASSSGACTVLDENLNLMVNIGSKGTVFTSGEYSSAVDMTFSATSNKYLVACPVDHIVQVYKSSGVFDSTLGTPDTAGVPTTGSILFNTPVAVGVGERGIYVACAAGTVDTLPGGYIGFMKPDLSEPQAVLYPGKLGGTGKIFEGEVSGVKDMLVLSNPDKLVVLNGSDEIGIFDVDTGFKLERVINIPSEIYNTALGLSRLTADSTTIYVSAAATGEVIAIDIKTGKLVGKFGELRNESTLNTDHTLGYFNGLSGITLFQDKVITTESINNRIQSFGAYLLKAPAFTIDFKPVVVSDSAQVKYITVPAGTVIPNDVRIIDTDLNQEYTVDTALARKVKRFFVRFYIKPSSFSLNKPAVDLFPVHILCEDN